MARFWRANIVGYYISGTWLGEQAQMGISGVGIEGGGDFDPRINQPLPTFTAYASGESLEDADFHTYAGSVGDGAWTLNKQVQLAKALVNFASATKTYQSTNFRWQYVYLSAFDFVGGKWTVVNGATMCELKSPVVGGGASYSGGADRAVVVSYRTAGRGPRNRGRIYVPTPTASTDSGSGLNGPAVRTALGNGARTLYDAVDAIPGLTQCVVSKKWSTYSAINSIEVGDEWDIQRRRRKSRPEVYTRY